MCISPKILSVLKISLSAIAVLSEQVLLLINRLFFNHAFTNHQTFDAFDDEHRLKSETFKCREVR